jgi:RND family efflux transporter MFP subunit
MAKVRLAYTQIRVPQNHHSRLQVVGERYVDEGAMLAANNPIVSILDIGTLTAVIHVIERDYPKIQPGLEALTATDAFPGRTFPGRVVRIAPLLKEKSREARVEIEISNKDRLLKPGMFVRVEIQFQKHENATVVPTAALVKRDGTQGVFMANLDQQKARFVPVTVGIVNGNEAEILNPLLNGSVVTLGHHLLEDGATIILPGSKPTGKSGHKPVAADKKADSPSLVRGKI